mmetsp:Transcript_43881/g.115849  ORF Transcript_43881/g.115849 Transcript_43881/m.115849 type:complete len:251 (+) Transcript_43881:728-1480(+)
MTLNHPRASAFPGKRSPEILPTTEGWIWSERAPVPACSLTSLQILVLPLLSLPLLSLLLSLLLSPLLLLLLLRQLRLKVLDSSMPGQSVGVLGQLESAKRTEDPEGKRTTACPWWGATCLALLQLLLSNASARASSPATPPMSLPPPPAEAAGAAATACTGTAAAVAAASSLPAGGEAVRKVWAKASAAVRRWLSSRCRAAARKQPASCPPLEGICNGFRITSSPELNGKLPVSKPYTMMPAAQTSTLEP